MAKHYTHKVDGIPTAANGENIGMLKLAPPIGDFTTATTTGVAITDMEFAGEAGRRYDIDCVLKIQTFNNSGVKYGVYGPADAVVSTAGMGFASSGTTAANGGTAAVNTLTSINFITMTVSGGFIFIKGTVDVVTAGTISVHIAPVSGTGGGCTVLRAGSYAHITLNPI